MLHLPLLPAVAAVVAAGGAAAAAVAAAGNAVTTSTLQRWLKESAPGQQPRIRYPSNQLMRLFQGYWLDVRAWGILDSADGRININYINEFQWYVVDCWVNPIANNIRGVGWMPCPPSRSICCTGNRPQTLYTRRFIKLMMYRSFRFD